MKLLRFKKTKTAVMGLLKDDVGGTYFTIENANALIPAGVYKVEVSYSKKFEKELPLLHNDEVPASRGIRIHGGNYYYQSQGCIILGNNSYLEFNSIGSAANAMKQLLAHCGSSLEISDLE